MSRQTSIEIRRFYSLHVCQGQGRRRGIHAADVNQLWTSYFSYSVDAVTCVVTWSVCDGRTSGEAGAASQTDSRDVERGTCRADVADYIFFITP